MNKQHIFIIINIQAIKKRKYAKFKTFINVNWNIVNECNDVYNAFKIPLHSKQSLV